MHVRIQAKGHRSTSNPFGVIFHPWALQKNCELIAQSIDRKHFDSFFKPTDIYFHRDIYHSLQHANRFQHSNKVQLMEDLYSMAHQAHHALKEAGIIAITLGTAWLYNHKPSGTFVGNCHKLPQQDFEKILSTQSIIQNQILGILRAIQQINTKAPIVFTVSPVRHLRDGVSENLRSKSTLISALTEVLANHEPNLHYFPAYEIVREELNDWRYYTEDKMHPTPEAINIVFDRFYKALFSTNDSTSEAVL